MGIRIYRHRFTLLAFPYVDADEVLLVPFPSGSLRCRMWELGGQLHLVYAIGMAWGLKLILLKYGGRNAHRKGNAVFSGIDIGAIYRWESVDYIGTYGV